MEKYGMDILGDHYHPVLTIWTDRKLAKHSIQEKQLSSFAVGKRNIIIWKTYVLEHFLHVEIDV